MRARWTPPAGRNGSRGSKGNKLLAVIGWPTSRGHEASHPASRATPQSHTRPQPPHSQPPARHRRAWFCSPAALSVTRHTDRQPRRSPNASTFANMHRVGACGTDLHGLHLQLGLLLRGCRGPIAVSCPGILSQSRRTNTCVRHFTSNALRTVSAAPRNNPNSAILVDGAS